MKIIQPHKRPSRKVEKLSEIKEDVEALKKLIVSKEFVGKYKDAFAIHHAQVSENPYNFFVLHPNLLVKELYLKDQVIINPRIIGTSEAMKKDLEGCMSFGFRPLKFVNRFRAVEVEYEVPALFGRLKTKKFAWDDLVARIFQHEIDHAKGINIYDK